MTLEEVGGGAIAWEPSQKRQTTCIFSKIMCMKRGAEEGGVKSNNGAPWGQERPVCFPRLLLKFTQDKKASSNTAQEF